jgi:hypothetical protein
MEKNLGAIKNQQGVEDIPWEVIVVDNASKDNTSDIVRQVWVIVKSSLNYFMKENLEKIMHYGQGLAKPVIPQYVSSMMIPLCAKPMYRKFSK